MSIPIIATSAGPSTDYCIRNAVHKSSPDYKFDITVALWSVDYYMGTAHINIKHWQGPEKLETASVESISIGYPPVWIREPGN